MAFPTDLDSFTDPSAGDYLDEIDHAGLHTSVNTAVEALETKVGINGSADTNSIDYKLANIITTVGDALMPVGHIYISGVATNPATLLGFGTWTQIEGKFLVGVSTTDTDFDLDDTGGAKTVTLTEAQMPSHTHVQNAHTHTQNSHNHIIRPGAGIGTSGGGYGLVDSGSATSTAGANATTNSSTATNQNTTATNQNTGGDGAHENLPPYIAKYVWQRTA